jgi:hypothetical protein
MAAPALHQGVEVLMLEQVRTGKRMIGRIRRECLDGMILISEKYRRAIVKSGLSTQ